MAGPSSSQAPATPPSTLGAVAPPPLYRDSPEWRDWANLREGLARRIADHALTNDVADYLHFRAVCAPWRSHTQDPKPQSVLDSRYHPRRWILLPPPPVAAAANTRDDGRREMMSLTTGRKITVDLPDLLGHAVAAGSGGSPGGVLVLIDERSLIVRLLNPLTGQFIDFPSVAPALSRRREGRLDREFANLSRVSGAGFAGDSTVVLHFGWDNRLLSAKLGDDSWEVVGEGGLLCSTFPFAGEVYFANRDGLMRVDGEATPPRLVLAAEWPQEWTIVHMADGGAELLVLMNRLHFKPDDDYLVEHDMYRLDAGAKAGEALVPVSDLGERAMFAGDLSGGVAVSSKDLVAIAPNAIYFQHSRYNRFYVRRISDGRTRLLPEPARGSLLHDITSYVAWTGRKDN